MTSRSCYRGSRSSWSAIRLTHRTRGDGSWLSASNRSPPAQSEPRSGPSITGSGPDEDGIPTLVEIKRQSDSRIRREVVGQMLPFPVALAAARFGDKRIVALGMAMMLIGGAMASLVPESNMLLASRLLAGAGGVILNVVMTKMLFDWFVGREISTAMAIFVNSWPVGIAIALLTLPLIVEAAAALAWWTVTWTILAGLVLLLLFYRAPKGAADAIPDIRPSRLPIYPLVLASTIWALYNAALAMVVSFGPALLSEQGWTLAAAGSAISVFMVVFSVAVPLGGVLADRTVRRDEIILVSLTTFAVLMPRAHLPPSAITFVFLVVGGLFALAGAPIMTLPSTILSPESPRFGMGVFSGRLRDDDDRPATL